MTCLIILEFFIKVTFLLGKAIFLGVLFSIKNLNYADGALILISLNIDVILEYVSYIEKYFLGKCSCIANGQNSRFMNIYLNCFKSSLIHLSLQIDAK